MDLIQKLEGIQKNLNAPKNQFNKFGKYNYRNCEDILQAVKPHLNGCVILVTDELVNIGSRFYVKATAYIRDASGSIGVDAYAREDESKKGMDACQLTGSTSSYARKYALNGLLLIDDNKDADSRHPKDEQTLDDTALAWVKAVKSGASKLDDINDVNYRKFIEENL